MVRTQTVTETLTHTALEHCQHSTQIIFLHTLQPGTRNHALLVLLQWRIHIQVIFHS